MEGKTWLLKSIMKEAPLYICNCIWSWPVSWERHTPNVYQEIHWQISVWDKLPQTLLIAFVSPDLQRQRNDGDSGVPFSSQVPPFWHGFVVQALSAEESAPRMVNKSHCTITHQYTLRSSEMSIQESYWCWKLKRRITWMLACMYMSKPQVKQQFALVLNWAVILLKTIATGQTCI